MNRLLLIIGLSAATGASAQIITSVQNGNASNPLTWNCTCFPLPTSTIVINHAVALDYDWAVTGGGSITVNSGGSLTEVGEKDMLIDGAGSKYINHGTSSFTSVAYTNGATGSNSGTYNIDKALYFQGGTTYTNSGTINQLDSLLTEGNFTNSGAFYAGNFLNTGTLSNTGYIAGDSVGNSGTLNITGGSLLANAFGNAGTFSIQTAGYMDVSGDWYNSGTFTVGAGRDVHVGDDFFNGDTIGATATLTNNGVIEVLHDFYNSRIMNGSGNFCVSGDSYNSGNVTGTLDFCDNTGNDFDFNSGTIAGTVTFCQPGCFVGLDENGWETVSLFPNPATHVLHVQSNLAFETAAFYAASGSLVKTVALQGTTIDLGGIPAGIYFVQLQGHATPKPLRVVVQ